MQDGSISSVGPTTFLGAQAVRTMSMTSEAEIAVVADTGANFVWAEGVTASYAETAHSLVLHDFTFSVLIVRDALNAFVPAAIIKPFALAVPELGRNISDFAS